MSYFKTAYDTTQGQIFSVSMSKVNHALKAALVEGSLANRQLGVEPLGLKRAVFLIGGANEENGVPTFIHPTLISNYKEHDYLITDIRLFRNTQQQWVSDRDFELAIKNKTEYALTKSRAALNLLWLGEDVARIRGRFSFAGIVYAAWLTQAITKTFALDPKERLIVTAVSLYFYHSLFIPGSKLEGNDLETAVVHTIKATKLPATEIYALFESLPPLTGISDLPAAIQAAIPNVRLRELNLALLLTQVRNTWFGLNSKEMISVALEHPPTWIAIVYSTLTERSYKASTLYKVIETESRRGNADEFRMNYNELVWNSIVVQETITPPDPYYVKPFED